MIIFSSDVISWMETHDLSPHIALMPKNMSKFHYYRIYKARLTSVVGHGILDYDNKGEASGDYSLMLTLPQLY